MKIKAKVTIMAGGKVFSPGETLDLGETDAKVLIARDFAEEAEAEAAEAAEAAEDKPRRRKKADAEDASAEAEAPADGG